MHYPGEPAPGPFERFFKAARIGHGEFSVRGWFIADLVGFVVVTALVFWDQVIGLIPGVDEFSFLNPALWPWWIGVALVISALHVAVTGLARYRGGWEMRTAVANAVLLVPLALGFLWFGLTDQLMNPMFIYAFLAGVTYMLTPIASALLGVFVAVSYIVAITEGFVRARRRRAYENSGAESFPQVS